MTAPHLWAPPVRVSAMAGALGLVWVSELSETACCAAHDRRADVLARQTGTSVPDVPAELIHVVTL